MAEERLKTFGDLLKESIGQRMDGGEDIVPVDDPIMMSDEDRAAIFEKLAGKKLGVDKLKAEPVKESSEDMSGLPFGELLERTIKMRSEVEKVDVSADDEIREAIIEKSKVDMVDGLMRRFMR